MKTKVIPTDGEILEIYKQVMGQPATRYDKGRIIRFAIEVIKAEKMLAYKNIFKNI